MYIQPFSDYLTAHRDNLAMYNIYTLLIQFRWQVTYVRLDLSPKTNA